jgi:two-component system LytT family response regulator
MIQVIIVDDEQSGSNVLKRLLQDYFPGVEIQAVCSTIQEAELQIRRAAPHILFLDIEMPGGDGFQLLQNLGSVSFPVVFVTAYNEYAIRALRLSAADYLLKPVNKNDVEQAINKCRQLFPFRIQHPVIYPAVLFNSTASDNRVLVINKYTQESISFKDICCIVADSNYAVIHMTSKKHVMVARPLKELEELLCEESHHFIRIHKSVIVNSSYIQSTKTSGGVLSLYLPGDFIFEVSKRKKAEVETILQKLKHR